MLLVWRSRQMALSIRALAWPRCSENRRLPAGRCCAVTVRTAARWCASPARTTCRSGRCAAGWRPIAQQGWPGWRAGIAQGGEPRLCPRLRHWAAPGPPARLPGRPSRSAGREAGRGFEP